MNTDSIIPRECFNPHTPSENKQLSTALASKLRFCFCLFEGGRLMEEIRRVEFAEMNSSAICFYDNQSTLNFHSKTRLVDPIWQLKAFKGLLYSQYSLYFVTFSLLCSLYLQSESESESESCRTIIVHSPPVLSSSRASRKSHNLTRKDSKKLQSQHIQLS